MYWKIMQFNLTESNIAQYNISYLKMNKNVLDVDAVVRVVRLCHQGIHCLRQQVGLPGLGFDSQSSGIGLVECSQGIDLKSS